MRTTYLDSMITNRAMDYRWSNGLSNRDVFQYGPFTEDLEHSKLSNHIGFNGFVISSDGYIPFVKRNSIVSIGKNTYGDSIGASLKVKYALKNENEEINSFGLIKAFLKEIEDELKIKKDDLDEFSIENNLIAAYRDIVEGGKPQFLIYAQALLTKDEIQIQFEQVLKEKKKNKALRWDKELKELEDGSKFVWIHKEDLKRIAISPGLIVYNGKKMYMMPSASASIIMFMEWMKNNENI